MRVIAGTARSIPLETPEGLSTRPTTDRVKEAVFSALQFELEGRTVLDLFAGSGQLGIEALSRGAAHAVFVDADKKAIGCIQRNLKKTGFSERAEVFCSEAEMFLKRNKRQFSMIFLDPPYHKNLLHTAVSGICEFDILSPGGIIVAEMPREMEPSFALEGFLKSKEYGFGAAKVIIYRKECKL